LLTIPRPALIQRSNSQHVLLAEDDGYFRPVPVATGQEAGDRVVIRVGLTEGKQLVVCAQFRIDSETNLEAATMRLEAQPQNTGDTGSDHSSSPLIESAGLVTELDTDSASITLEHDPIPALGWPSMVMPFDLAETVGTDDLAPGQTVNFHFRETPEGYLIEHIEPVQHAH